MIFLEKTEIEHVLVRSEQNGCSVKQAVLHVPAVKRVFVYATSGPGATNLITGLATAYMDSIPLVAITGQVNSELLGRDVFQEADVTGACESFTKHSYLVKNVEDIPRVFKGSLPYRDNRPSRSCVDRRPYDIQRGPSGRVHLS